MPVASFRSLRFTDGTVQRVPLVDLPRTVIQQSAIADAQVTSGTDELTVATISIARQPSAYVLVCAAHFSGFNSVDDDIFESRIKVDTVQKSEVRNRHEAGTNERLVYPHTTSLAVTIAANTACTVICTVLRTSGTGTLTTEDLGILTAQLYF